MFTLGYEGNDSVPFRINPFEKIDGVPLQLHIDYLLSSFKASFELYPPMPYILETSVYNVYAELGWDVLNDRNTKGRTDYPTLDDLYYEVEIVAEELANGAKWKSDVVASLQARIKSLMIGGKGAMLNTKKSYPTDKLLALPTVLELDSIGDDDVKSFVISMIMVQVYEFRKSQLGNVTKKGLSHVLLIEEAHRLLKNVSTSQGGESANPQGKAVEFFCNMLAEIRSYGQGLLISDQMPTKLAPDVLKNTNLKICHRIVTKEDRELLGSSMNMTSDQVESISMFNTGYAAIYSEGDSRPQLVKLPLVKNINAKTRQQILLESLQQVKNNMPSKQSKKDSSIDGMREEYEKRKAFVDGKKYFDQIISAIQLLTNHDIQVMLRVNVDKNNIDSCYQLIEYLKETLSQKVEIHVAPLYGCGNSYLTADNVTSVLTKLQSKIDSMGFKRTIRKSINEKYCRDSQQRNLVIKPDGDIIHCEHMYNEKNAIIGNVFDGITSDTGWICDKCKNYTICKLGCTDEKKIDCTACWKTIWRN